MAREQEKFLNYEKKKFLNYMEKFKSKSEIHIYTHYRYTSLGFFVGFSFLSLY